jgi:AcrR family transcriptional regulator
LPATAAGAIVTDFSSTPILDLQDTTAGRILRTAYDMVLREYYSGLTMDALAYALGMSKKTVYAHFASKDAIMAALIEAIGATIRRRVGEVIAGPGAFPHKLAATLAIVGSYFAALSPGFLQDLQRFAPGLYSEIDKLKERNIPTVFGSILRLGVEQGMVRDDVDVAFLTEFWLQTVKGVHEPASLARADLTPKAAFDKALDLFFRGILTPKGRSRIEGQDREKRGKH